MRSMNWRAGFSFGGAATLAAMVGAGVVGAGTGTAAAQPCQPAWSALGSGTNHWVLALTEFDDGSGGGPALYAGGAFNGNGQIAKWDGAAWSALGSGMNSTVHALTVFDDGSGPALYAGGDFATAGGVTVNGIAKWEGAAWSALGSGMNGTVNALSVFDDGSGPAFYAGGDFTTAGVVTVNRIAKWDGTAWSALGSGMNIGSVRALTVFDDGSGGGPALYAGGFFTTAGGVSANSIAKWDGAAWSALGGGLNSLVSALTVFDDGSGPALYAGGLFTTAGGVSVYYIAKWDGTAWSALGAGMSGGFFLPSVYALTVFDDGSGGGPALYAGGGFTTAGGVSANYIAKWDGAAWSALGSGMNGGVLALTVFDDGSGGGPALYAGGLFTTAGGLPASNIARWGCPPALCYADCDQNGTLDIDDFICFQLEFALQSEYADCDGNQVHNIDDFICFQLAFALGCP